MTDTSGADDYAISDPRHRPWKYNSAAGPEPPPVEKPEQVSPGVVAMVVEAHTSPEERELVEAGVLNKEGDPVMGFGKQEEVIKELLPPEEKRKLAQRERWKRNARAYRIRQKKRASLARHR
jgi:hypothetical protein